VTISISQILERFPTLLTPFRGDYGTEIKALASPDDAQTGEMVFIADKKFIGPAAKTAASAWVVQKHLISHIPSDVKACILTSPNSQLALALVGREFFPQKLNKVPFETELNHPSAVVHPTAVIGDGTIIGPNTTIGAKVKIGPSCIIGANTTIEAEVNIGAHTHIHPQVYIAYKTQIGQNCEIHPQCSIGSEGFGYAHDEKGGFHRLTHYGRVVIEDRVHIGSGVLIDRGTFSDSRIGEGTIIDNQCHFGHNIEIGKGTIITGGAIAAGSVKIGSRCVIGGRTSMAGHLTVTDGCQFAALSGINSSVTEPGVYGGYPLQPVKDALKTTASIAQLPRMRRQITQILKALKLDSKVDLE
jgi:UDP-3-O-[3-hydroxymyristoyl] glucosamine N-acyltransferase